MAAKKLKCSIIKWSVDKISDNKASEVLVKSTSNDHIFMDFESTCFHFNGIFFLHNYLVLCVEHICPRPYFSSRRFKCYRIVKFICMISKVVGINSNTRTLCVVISSLSAKSLNNHLRVNESSDTTFKNAI